MTEPKVGQRYKIAGVEVEVKDVTPSFVDVIWGADGSLNCFDMTLWSALEKTLIEPPLQVGDWVTNTNGISGTIRHIEGGEACVWRHRDGLWIVNLSNAIRVDKPEGVG